MICAFMTLFVIGGVRIGHGTARDIGVHPDGAGFTSRMMSPRYTLAVGLCVSGCC